VFDDVVSIELRAIAGVIYGLVDKTSPASCSPLPPSGKESNRVGHDHPHDGGHDHGTLWTGEDARERAVTVEGGRVRELDWRGP
jgi:hypothetical protein